MEIKFVGFDEQFLERSWYWLQNESLRSLINAEIITKEEQYKWFRQLPERKDYLIWGIMYNGIAVGVCGLKNITKHEGEYLGYIGEEAYWGKGIGSYMMKHVEKAATSLKLNTLYLKVIDSNKRAINLYMREGYIVESSSNHFLQMKKNVKYD